MRKVHGNRLLLLLLPLILSFLLSSCKKDYDPAGYTQSVLNLQFQGETDGAGDYAEDVSVSEMMRQYTNFIDQMTAELTSGMELTESQSEDFSEVLSNIFSAQRYEVTGAEKIAEKEYEVSVKIWPMSTFVNFNRLLTQDSIAISNKLKQGEYEGTEEEIEEQMNQEIIADAYEALQQAFSSCSYGEEQSVKLKVRINKDDQYSIDEEDMSKLILKLLRIDEIQG